MLNAKNGHIRLRSFEMDYIRFGNGKKTLVMIPGVGDGLKTVKGMAAPFSVLYRSLASDFTVYVFSRRVDLVPGMTTRDMAKDLDKAMKALGLSRVCLAGVSQGGMIAQWLAIDYPERVSRLILAVTLSRPNPTLQGVVGNWIRMAEAGDYRGIMLDTAEHSYTEERLRKTRKMYELLGSIGKPKSFDRFIIQANSCLAHDAYDELPKIACPVLVIGGTDDKIVTGKASAEIAGQIRDCRLKMYYGLGHGLYENKDFLDQVKRFMNTE